LSERESIGLEGALLGEVSDVPEVAAAEAFPASDWRAALRVGPAEGNQRLKTDVAILR
jgi:hypothetical protein